MWHNSNFKGKIVATVIWSTSLFKDLMGVNIDDPDLNISQHLPSSPASVSWPVLL